MVNRMSLIMILTVGRNILKIIKDLPPMFDVIAATFNVINKSVIFTFGDTIYNPMGVKVTRELQKHEEVHSERQLSMPRGPEEWWEKYIRDKDFRLAEESPAHRAEYLAYCKRHGSGRDKYLVSVAGRLSSSLYGGIVDFKRARELVLGIA